MMTVGHESDPRSVAEMLRRGPASAAQERIRGIGVLLILIGVTFAQRLCFPFGVSYIALSLPLTYVALLLFLLSGTTRISVIGLMLFSLTVASAILTLFWPKVWFSTFSFFYLVALYLVYIFTIDVPQREYLGYLRIFQNFMVVMAAIALLQFAEQATTGSRLSLFDYVPNGFVVPGYNTRPVLYWQSTFHKSNADFFLEPSFLSQFMAVAIIIEILFFGRLKRMALYGAAIFASFSGTGMVLLAIFALVSVIRARRFELLWPAPVLVLLYFLFHDNPYVTAITNRFDELNAAGSSGSMRFVTPNEALFDMLYNNFNAFLVGKGPGTVEMLGTFFHYPDSNYPAIHKMLIEYGIVGTLPFVAFIVFSFFGRARSGVLAAALFFMYLVLSGSLLQPHTIYLFYALTILMPAQQEEFAPRRAAATPAYA